MGNYGKLIAAESRSSQLLNKVSEVSIFFWMIKILATTVGETAADFLNENLNLGLTITTVVMSGFLLLSLFFQFRSKKYVPAIYWLSVVLISVVGTLVTDNLVDHLGISLELTTIAFTLALLITLGAWFASEKTLSIHSINTTKRELFYWLAILFTFALGTAAGDLAAEGLDLGYWVSALVFAAMIVLVTVAYYVFKLNALVAFWIAYILTRPLGASFGDFLSQPREEGGLALGTVVTSVLFLSLILALVIYMTKNRSEETTPSISKGRDI